jgi:hypothetical protein
MVMEKENFKVFQFVDVENLHMFIKEGMTYQLDDSCNEIYYCEYEAKDLIDAIQMMDNLNNKGFNLLCECEKGIFDINELEEVYN